MAMASTLRAASTLRRTARSRPASAVRWCSTRAGATAFGLGRREEALENARAGHPGIRWLSADVADSRAVHDAIASAVSEAGRLDVVVNNAGIFRFAPLDQTTEDLSS